MSLVLPVVSFSPVAGIQWVETAQLLSTQLCSARFSPVAGIQWVETNDRFFYAKNYFYCFSPVAGIQWVET